MSDHEEPRRIVPITNEPDAPEGASDEPPARLEAAGPPFPPLPAPDGRCPVGMAFVPGGRWTAAQAKRLAKHTRTIPGDEMRFAEEVRDFCLDITEFTLGASARCIAGGDCRMPTPTARSIPAAAAELESLARLLDASDLARWREAWDALAALPRVALRPAEAMDLCAGHGRRLPTIEEWLWVAWGGAEDRRYPWGKAKPDASRLNICDAACETGDEDRDGFPGPAPVGRFPEGAARWGQLDIAGNVDEWVLTLPSTALQGDAAALGVQYGTSCGAESDTQHSEFVKAWPLPCGAIGEIRELGEDAYGGFRCAADLPAQAVDVR